MDDLADAIQDAAYIGAMCTSIPQPTQPLTLPSHEEALAFVRRLESSASATSAVSGMPPVAPLGFETVLGDPLGWYLLKKYLRLTVGNDAHVPLDFIEDVTAYASIGRPGLRLTRAVEIANAYFRKRPVPVTTPPAPVRTVTDDAYMSASASAGAATTVVSYTPQHADTSAPPPTGWAAGDDAVMGGARFRSPADSSGPPSVIQTPASSATSVAGVIRAEGVDAYADPLAAAAARAAAEAAPRSRFASCLCFGSAPTAPAPALGWTPGNKQDVLFRPGARVHSAVAGRTNMEYVAALNAAYTEFRDARWYLNLRGRLVDAAVQAIQAHLQAKNTDGGTVFYEANVLTHTATIEAAAAVATRADSRAIGAVQAAVAIRAGLVGPVSEADSGLPRGLFDAIRDVVLEGVRMRHWRSFMSSPAFTRYLQFKTMESRPVGVTDFTLFRVLGRGGFGVVHGCKKNDTGHLYAMKTMNKRRIKAKTATDLCWNERIVLGKVDSPFVISLKYAFQTSEDLYLLLDLATGGDLAYHLSKEVRFTEDRARFYAAQILLGLEHLHSLQIVYRDLKPENILLDEHGNAKISDMGLATHVTPNLCGRCGTRGYWAPEMLVKVEGKRQTYGFAVDWWSFGCLLYEFLSGKCPFRTEAARSLDPDKHKSMDKATLHLDVPYDERYFSPAARSLTNALLTRDPARRLGARGAAEIKAHPFFDPIDWGLLEAGLLPAPWVPETSINAAAQDMIGAFDDSAKKITLDDEDQARYVGWEVVNRFAFQAEMVEFLSYQDTRAAAGGVDTEMAPATDDCCVVM